MRLLSVISALLLFVAPALSEQSHCPAPSTHLSMDKGEYSPQPGAVFSLQDFSAEMVARGKAAPACFMKVTDIQHGDVFISDQSLSRVFNRKMKQSDSKIHDFKIETKDNKIAMSGSFKKLISVPFTLEGPVSTDGHSLIFQASEIKAAGIPVGGLLDALGKHLSNMLQSESVKGVVVKGNTLIFEPEQIAGVRGHISSAGVTPKGLVVKFSQATNTKLAKK